MTRKRRGRGEGSVFERADGTWVGEVSLGTTAAGRRIRRTVYGKSKAEVLADLRRIQSEHLVGRLDDAGKLTVAEFLTRWLEHSVAERVRPATRRLYETRVRLQLAPTLGKYTLAELRPVHVEGAMALLKVGGAGVRVRQQAATILKAALTHAQRLHMVPFNAAAGVVKPRSEEREVRPLTADQARHLLDHAKGLRLYALFAVALGTGMRQGEILGLQWEDVNLEQGTVLVRRSLSQVKGSPALAEPKTRQSRRLITLPRSTADALAAHRGRMAAEGHGSPFVFCSEAGTPVLKSNFVRRVFHPLLKRAGLAGVRFHDLRHTHASILLSQGCSLKAVSARLGHANPTLTLRVYAHVMPADDQALALKLDGVLLP